jgi:hypothetical protein
MQGNDSDPGKILRKGKKRQGTTSVVPEEQQTDVGL